MGTEEDARDKPAAKGPCNLGSPAAEAEASLFLSALSDSLKKLLRVNVGTAVAMRVTNYKYECPGISLLGWPPYLSLLAARGSEHSATPALLRQKGRRNDADDPQG